MLIKVGERLASAVSDTEVIVVRPPAGDVEITCGGVPMRPLGQAVAESQPAPPDEPGTVLGKRYVLPGQGLELLCTKAGAGSLRAGGVALEIKKAKSLPSSD